jgi:glutamate N-acetyltransferase/amino-acid N-acetyltransferase
MAGIKKKGLDLAVVSSTEPAAAAGVFTTSSTAAAPVRLSTQRLADGNARAVVVNSGCANACTGPQGDADALAMADALEEELGLETGEALVCSTGLIGSHLPMKAVLEAIPRAVAALGEDAGDASLAILTTDTKPKSAVADGPGWRIGGMAKGAGMIAPNMATMLAIVTTDAVVDPRTLAEILSSVVAETFNRISVDGDTSTNDSVILFANGASGAKADPEEFQTSLKEVCASLAEQIVADAEGKTRLVRISVTGADSQQDADSAARAVGESLLVKTAAWGGDPNWGRVAAALGKASTFSVDSLTIEIAGVPLFVKGKPQGSLEDARAGMKGTEIEILCALGDGAYSSHFLTCDLSPEYVTFNGSYES